MRLYLLRQLPCAPCPVSSAAGEEQGEGAWALRAPARELRPPALPAEEVHEIFVCPSDRYTDMFAVYVSFSGKASGSSPIFGFSLPH